MVKDCNHGVPTTPKDIMDSGNHFDDCPRTSGLQGKVQSNVVMNNELSQTVLLNHAIDSHKTRPHANMRSRIKK